MKIAFFSSVAFVTGDVFCAHHLKGECDRGRQHQQRVDGGGVGEAGRPEQAGGDDVVNQIRNADEPGTSQQSQAAAEKLVFAASLPSPAPRWERRRVVRRGREFFREVSSSSQCILEQSEVHDRKQRRLCWIRGKS